MPQKRTKPNNLWQQHSNAKAAKATKREDIINLMNKESLTEEEGKKNYTNANNRRW